MASGYFHPFNIPYGSHKPNDAHWQAIQILDNVRALHDNGKGYHQVGLTYSANQGQTEKIKKVYGQHQWNTETTGSNQAEVITQIEKLLAADYKDLQTVFRIIPITTIPTHSAATDADKAKLIEIDLADTKKFLEAGNAVMGWQNQDSHPNKPYAIGGGITQLSADNNHLVQTTLSGYASAYANKKASSVQPDPSAPKTESSIGPDKSAPKAESNIGPDKGEPKLFTSNRTDKYTDDKNAAKIQQILQSQYKWKILPSSATNPAIKKVADESNKVKFSIEPNKLSTNDDDKQIFIAMLTCHQAIYGKDQLPIVTTHNDAAVKLWQEAFKDVYGPSVNTTNHIKLPPSAEKENLENKAPGLRK